MLTVGDLIEIVVEKAAVGGRMIARHNGQVVLVRGAIPGERVIAQIELRGSRMAYAATVDVLDAAHDRRPTTGDPACGGAVYAHIGYERQLALKTEILADAFTRIGRLSLPAPVPVEASPEQGYRMRARLHVREGRIGFFREDTNDLCDATRTGQLGPEAAGAIRALGATLRSARLAGLEGIELSENLAADGRAINVLMAPRAQMSVRALLPLARVTGLDGITCARSPFASGLVVHGTPYVFDPVEGLLPDRELAIRGVRLRRHARAFFQGNRFLVPVLVGRVVDLVLDGPVADLYAGVGLFGVSMAALGRREITAVEVDRVSVSDLEANAASFTRAIAWERSTVEGYLRRTAPRARTIVVDPPRTGLSRAAAEGLRRHAPDRIVYVSCDPATLARDAHQVVESGYDLTRVEALDFFPNTAHVETIAVFDRRPPTSAAAPRSPSDPEHG